MLLHSWYQTAAPGLGQVFPPTCSYSWTVPSGLCEILVTPAEGVAHGTATCTIWLTHFSSCFRSIKTCFVMVLIGRYFLDSEPINVWSKCLELFKIRCANWNAFALVKKAKLCDELNILCGHFLQFHRKNNMIIICNTYSTMFHKRRGEVNQFQHNKSYSHLKKCKIITLLVLALSCR